MRTPAPPRPYPPPPPPPPHQTIKKTQTLNRTVASMQWRERKQIQKWWNSFWPYLTLVVRHGQWLVTLNYNPAVWLLCPTDDVFQCYIRQLCSLAVYENGHLDRRPQFPDSLFDHGHLCLCPRRVQFHKYLHSNSL